MINGVYPQNRKLSIFYTNDLHGNTDNVGGLQVASKAFDKKALQTGADTLKLSGGDNYSGENNKKNNLIMSMLSQMGIKYSAVGNHEFDAMSDNFAKNIQNNKINYVSSNLNINPTNKLSQLVKGSTIEVINGEKYGIVGLTTDELEKTATSSEAIKGIKVSCGAEGVQKLQTQIDSLKQQGVNKIVMLSHSGFEVDRNIVSKIDGVDIIVGGHSHDIVQGTKNHQNVIYDKNGHPVIVLQTGENGKNYGVLDVEFDGNGVIKKVNNQVYKTQNIVSPIIKYIEDATMGKSPVVAKIKSAEPFPQNKRINPSGWSNFICDAMRSEMNVDIAFMNAANIRKVPQVGNLTVRAITETTPFKNHIITTTMNEKEIVDAVKFGASSFKKEDGYPGIVQTSGLRYKVDKNGNLLELNFVNKNGQITPINIQNPNINKTYTVAYDSFMADGREYPIFSTQNKQVQKFENTFKDALTVNYISKMPDNVKNALEIKDDGRVQIV
ncbi:MAG: bifunctional metallophosphatase/5'-nucleotidase [Cyanobacteria bacterium SIG30]|nr:bifunctional metallophosphatase/5'-nucleotidase [Cyanobacteria bacterium SIG30]